MSSLISVNSGLGGGQTLASAVQNQQHNQSQQQQQQTTQQQQQSSQQQQHANPNLNHKTRNQIIGNQLQLQQHKIDFLSTTQTTMRRAPVNVSNFFHSFSHSLLMFLNFYLIKFTILLFLICT